MAKDTAIGWCHHTGNFWWGCEKISPGCANCYAAAWSRRMGKELWGSDAPRQMVNSTEPTLRKLNRKAGENGVRERVFCQSMSDFFEEHDGPIIDSKKEFLKSDDGSPMTLNDLRKNAFGLFDELENLDFLLLTKRPENIRKMWPVPKQSRTFDPPISITEFCKNADLFCRRKNAQLLTSVENQEQADLRVPVLLKCRDLSPVLGLSVEPMLGPIDFNALSDGYWNLNALSGLRENPFGAVVDREYGPKIDWVICGCESGPKRRPMKIEWAIDLLEQCEAAGVAFFMKQMEVDGKVVTDISKFPKRLQVQQYPKPQS